MSEDRTVESIVSLLGGKENITAVTNCMTRLRTVVRSDSAVREKELKELPGVLAVIAGVWLLSKAEKHIRKHMPESMGIVFTPLLTVILCVIPYIFLIMPAFGFLSTGITWLISQICMGESVIVRILAGFISTAFFLPLVAMGMHHGLVALYTVQLQELGFVTLYPALAMAGAGQVSASIAIHRKARKAGNKSARASAGRSPWRFRSRPRHGGPPGCSVFS